MGAFDEREQGFERRMALDAELRFRALARRNKQLGLWVAGQSGHEGIAATEYANAFVDSEVGRDDDEALVATIGEALARAKIELSPHRIRRGIDEAMARALKDIQDGK